MAPFSTWLVRKCNASAHYPTQVPPISGGTNRWAATNAPEARTGTDTPWGDKKQSRVKGQLIRADQAGSEPK